MFPLKLIVLNRDINRGMIVRIKDSSLRREHPKLRFTWRFIDSWKYGFQCTKKAVYPAYL